MECVVVMEHTSIKLVAFITLRQTYIMGRILQCFFIIMNKFLLVLLLKHCNKITVCCYHLLDADGIFMKLSTAVTDHICAAPFVEQSSLCLHPLHWACKPENYKYFYS